jgi:hypothetical protein
VARPFDVILTGSASPTESADCLTPAATHTSSAACSITLQDAINKSKQPAANTRTLTVVSSPAALPLCAAAMRAAPARSCLHAAAQMWPRGSSSAQLYSTHLQRLTPAVCTPADGGSSAVWRTSPAAASCCVPGGDRSAAAAGGCGRWRRGQLRHRRAGATAGPGRRRHALHGMHLLQGQCRSASRMAVAQQHGSQAHIVLALAASLTAAKIICAVRC